MLDDLPRPTEKARILIVEDEPLLAFALEEFLIESGFEIAGVAGRLQSALAMVETGGFDVAILDANLAGVSAGPAASALRARGLPFIVVSGYSLSQLPSAFAGAPRLDKTEPPESLIRALHDILASSLA